MSFKGMRNSSSFDWAASVTYSSSPSNSDDNAVSASESAIYSSGSGDSSTFGRTRSDLSSLSEPIYDNEYTSDTLSPCWRPPKPVQDRGLLGGQGLKQHDPVVDCAHGDEEAADADLELMKEKFSKLLLGEDMSGSGKGVCTAVTISNAITNLYATVFGQNLRLEPLKSEKRAMWRREMDCLLSVCDFIVQFIPASQTAPDGTTLEYMETRLRSDIYASLPALKKLDAMLIDILDSFEGAEFCYGEQGSTSFRSTRSGSFRRAAQQKKDKWWVPVPCVPPDGLSEDSVKQLRNKRDSATQIHKAAKAINSSILTEMDVPDGYIASLPKSGRLSVGDVIYRYMCTTENFSAEHILSLLNISSEHEALELADRIEASMYTWRRKACLNPSRTSWVKDFMSDIDRTDKNHILSARAESLLHCLKHKYPELSQTSLDTFKIQCNRDVGQATLESYSRVLEGLAFNIVAWIDDVLAADRSERNQQ